jgi:prepilin-type N-terminal cleavage/methylation domain-containing protein
MRGSTGRGRMKIASRGVTLMEVLVVVALLGLAVGVGLALWPGRAVRAKAGLDGLEELWRGMRPGDCMEWRPAERLALFRRGGEAGVVYARWRAPREADAGRLRSFCDGGSVLVEWGRRAPLLGVVCADPGSGLPVWGVCRSPVGGVVFRTVVRASGGGGGSGGPPGPPEPPVPPER